MASATDGARSWCDDSQGSGSCTPFASSVPAQPVAVAGALQAAWIVHDAVAHRRIQNSVRACARSVAVNSQQLHASLVSALREQR